MDHLTSQLCLYCSTASKVSLSADNLSHSLSKQNKTKHNSAQQTATTSGRNDETTPILKIKSVSFLALVVSQPSADYLPTCLSVGAIPASLRDFEGLLGRQQAAAVKSKSKSNSSRPCVSPRLETH